jgi:parvulin-like peptidyl-prolyl isomerase
MKLKTFGLLIFALSLCPAQLLHAATPPKKATPPARKAEVEKKASAPTEEIAAIPEVVAVVEGAEIKKGELDKVLASVLGQSGRSPTELPAEQKTGAYRMILDDMIVEKLITRRAAAVKVGDEEVEATFKRATANMGSDQEVRLQIEQSGETIATVKENIRASLRQQRWVDEQLKGKTEVTEAEADDFFKKHPEQFKVPERVRASHILLTLKQDATPETVTKKQKDAEAIVERVKKGEDFSKLAKELSEDPSAKENNGDLNFFAREQMVPEFSEVAFKLGKDEVSEPVRTQFGYHVIKVTDRKAGENMSLEQAKPRLLSFLKQQKKQAEVEKLVREIREKADIKINLPPPAPTAATAPPAAVEKSPTAEKRP